MNSANATRAANVTDSANTFPHADPAERVIEGEQQAGDLLDRMQAGMAHPDALAVIVVYLHGELLQGFCRLIRKVLGARHG